MTATLPDQRKSPSPSPRAEYVPAESFASATDPRYLAHDTRNWLTVLGAYCDLLRNSRPEAEDHEQWVEDLADTVDRGRSLVLSLVESVEGPDQPEESAHKENEHAEEEDRRQADRPRRATLDVAAVLARRRPLFERLAGGRIQVEVDAPAGAGNVDMAEGAFERVLENLIGNAIEAMPEGGRLRIGLDRRDRKPSASSGSRSTPTLLLRVQDTGVGIAAERLPHIFDPGVSGKAEHAGDTHPRNGLGLAIVRELTERARGTVRVQSHPGQGSCFEVELPRQPAPDLSPDRIQDPSPDRFRR